MDDQLSALADEYWDGAMARSPISATMFGDHRFDDQVPDLSRDGLVELAGFAADISARAATFDDAELSAGGRVTRALLVDACANVVEEVDSGEIQLQSDGFTGVPVSLLRGASRLRAPDVTSAQRQLTRLRALPDVLDAVVVHWRDGLARGWTPASTIVARTRAMVDGHLAGAIEDDPFVQLSLPEGWDGTDGWRRSAATIVSHALRPAYQRVSEALAELEAAGRDDDHAGLGHVPGRRRPLRIPRAAGDDHDVDSPRNPRPRDGRSHRPPPGRVGRNRCSCRGGLGP